MSADRKRGKPHDGCNYDAFELRGFWFCDKCGFEFEDEPLADITWRDGGSAYASDVLDVIGRAAALRHWLDDECVALLVTPDGASMLAVPLDWLGDDPEPARTKRNGIRFGNQPYEGGTFKGIREE